MGEGDLRDREMPRSRVLVITEKREFSGFLHRMSPDRRETDVLNDERTFIHLTDVELRIKGEIPKEVPFVAVNKSNIICVIPEE
ncbi:MAG: hypothetical protein RRA15_10800 [bacterium]|nr:hypothetical protein [bacterium]MDT8366964.1 hypothetical protein [bacterium]